MSLSRKSERILEDFLSVLKLSVRAFESMHEKNFELAPREWLLDQVAKILTDPSTHREISQRIDQINAAAARRFVFEHRRNAVKAADEGITRWMMKEAS